MRSEPADAPPAQEAGWTRFPKKATYLPSAAIRRARIGLVPLLLIVPAVLWPFVFDGSPIGPGTLAFLAMTLVLLALGATIVRYALNARFEFDAGSITVTGLGRGKTLPLSRIQALTAKRQPRGGFFLVALHLKDGRRAPGFYVEPRHLRDDDLFAWLAAVPRRGGDVLARPPAAKKPARGPRLATPVLVTLALPFLWIIFAGPVDDLRALALGYPPLEQLSSVRGTVTAFGPCRPAGRGATYLPVEIATASGPAGANLPCSLEPLLRPAPGPHQIAVWRDKRLFAGDQVREIRIDGDAVQRYDTYVARRRHATPFFLLAHLLLIATLVLVIPAVFDRGARG